MMKKKLKKIRQRVTRWFLGQLARFGLVLAASCPLSWLLVVGEKLAVVVYWLFRRERIKTIHHLTLALADEKSPVDLARIARQCYQNLGKSLFEVLSFPQFNKDKIEELVQIEGQEHIDSALSQGKGLIMISAHLGNWELLALYVALQGYYLNVIARKVHISTINQLIIQLRQPYGVNTIVRRGQLATTRGIIRILANNGIVGMLMDQDAKVDGVFVDFFGHPAYTPRAPVALALLAKAPIVPAFITRGKDNQHQIVVYPQVTLALTGDKDYDIRENTAMLTRLIEDYIRRYPGQWVWMHRRWRRQPSDKR